MSVYEINNGSEVSEIERYRTKEELMTSTIFSADKKLNTIIQHIGGMPWILESYFTQLGDVNDNPEPISIEIGLHQNYERIMKLKVYLQSPIDQINPDELEGEFIVNAGFLPRLNDIFVAEVTGGRLGAFVITSVENNTYNNHMCYTCKFKLFVFLEDENVSYYNELIKKTIGVGRVYNEEYMYNQNTPLLTTPEYYIRQDLIKARVDLINYYLKEFINPDTKLLQYPTTENVYVDTYLLEFLFKIISYSEFPEMNKINRIDYKDKEIRNTIYDLLLSRNPQMLYRVDKYLGFKRVVRNRTNLNSRNISLLDIDYIICKLKENDVVVHTPENVEVDKTYKPNLEASVKMHHDKFITKTVDNIIKANSEFILSVPKLEFDIKKEDILEKEEVPDNENTDNLENEFIEETFDVDNIEEIPELIVPDTPSLDVEDEILEESTEEMLEENKEVEEDENIESETTITEEKESEEDTPIDDIEDENKDILLEESETHLESTNESNTTNDTTEEEKEVLDTNKDEETPIEEIVDNTDYSDSYKDIYSEQIKDDLPSVDLNLPKHSKTNIKATKQYSLFKKK